MKKWSLFLVLMSLATLAEAAPAKTHRNCKRCAHPCATQEAKPCTTAAQPVAAKGESYDAMGALLNGFSLTAGFRWDRECPEVAEGSTMTSTTSHVGNTDPFFVGAEARLPLNTWSDLGGNIDRDWTEAPHWNARVFVALHPWRK